MPAGNLGQLPPGVLRVEKQEFYHVYVWIGSEEEVAAGLKRQRAAGVLAAACQPAIEPLEDRRFFSFSPAAVLPTGVR